MIKLESAHIKQGLLSFGTEANKTDGIKVHKGRIYNILNKFFGYGIAVKTDKATVFLKKRDCEKYIHRNTPLNIENVRKHVMKATVLKDGKFKSSKAPTLSAKAILGKLSEFDSAATAADLRRTRT